jgi:hypothetical protein
MEKSLAGGCWIKNTYLYSLGEMSMFCINRDTMELPLLLLGAWPGAPMAAKDDVEFLTL